MELVRIYECLCDVTRLRILNVLLGGPRCVGDFQAALREPQVKISKHLAYLRARGFVTASRRGNRMIYALPARRPRELAANLACLQDCAAEQPVFRRDRARLDHLAAGRPEGQAGDGRRRPRRPDRTGREQPNLS